MNTKNFRRKNQLRQAVGEEPLDQAAQERLFKSIQQKRLIAFIAWKDRQPVGICTVSCAFSTFACREQGILDDFYVKPGFRGKGIARRLASAAQNWCRKEGLSGLLVICSTGDQDMYRSLGFDLPLGHTLVCNF